MSTHEYLIGKIGLHNKSSGGEARIRRAKGGPGKGVSQKPVDKETTRAQQKEAMKQATKAKLEARLAEEKRRLGRTDSEKELERIEKNYRRPGAEAARNVRAERTPSSDISKGDASVDSSDVIRRARQDYDDHRDRDIDRTPKSRESSVGSSGSEHTVRLKNTEKKG